MPIPFPTARIITPAEDATERAMHAIVTASNEFTHAILDATSVSRCLQLRERLGACMAVLDVARNTATEKADLLSAAKD